MSASNLQCLIELRAWRAVDGRNTDQAFYLSALNQDWALVSDPINYPGYIWTWVDMLNVGYGDVEKLLVKLDRDLNWDEWTLLEVNYICFDPTHPAVSRRTRVAHHGTIHRIYDKHEIIAG